MPEYGSGFFPVAHPIVGIEKFPAIAVSKHYDPDQLKQLGVKELTDLIFG